LKEASSIGTLASVTRPVQRRISSALLYLSSVNCRSSRYAQPVKPPAPLFLSELQRSLYELMEAQPQSVDALTQKLGQPVHKVLSALTQLEVYGLVESLPGHNYIYSKEK